MGKKRHGAVDIISGSLPLTMDNTEALRRVLTGCIEKGQPRLVLDCQQIPLIDSAGLELLLDIRQACARRGGQFQLAGLSPLCRDILQVTCVISGFEIYADSVVAAGSFRTMTSLTTQQPIIHTSHVPGSAEAIPLGDRLVRAGLLTADELEAALSEQSARQTRLGETLIELGFVSEDELIPLMGQHLGVASARLREGLIDPEAVRLIPKSLAESSHAIALFLVRGTLTVAMAEPQDLTVVDEIERVTGYRINPVFSLRTTIDKLLPRCYEEDFTVDAVTADMDQDAVEVDTQTIEVRLDDLQSMADGSPVISLVNYVIVHSVRQGSSDIHIEPGPEHSMVRFRVDGQLREVLRPRSDIHAAIVSRIKVMARMDIAEHRIPQDGRIRVRVEGREIDLRVSTLPTVLGEKVVMRVLDRRNVTFNLNELGVPADQLTAVKSMLARPYGLVLVTGQRVVGKRQRCIRPWN